MQSPPELFTPQEEKEIAKMIETNIDFAIEQKHIHEVDVEPPIDSDDL